jgi:hypothetical protein
MKFVKKVIAAFLNPDHREIREDGALLIYKNLADQKYKEYKIVLKLDPDGRFERLYRFTSGMPFDKTVPKANSAASVHGTQSKPTETAISEPNNTMPENENFVKFLDAVTKMGNKGLNALSAPANFSENLIRATEYRLALENGKSFIDAQNDAADVSGSFHKIGRLGGQAGRLWLRMLPYINAGLQTNYQIARALLAQKDNDEKGEKKKAALKKFLILCGLIFAVDVAMNERNWRTAEGDEALKANLASLEPSMQAMYMYWQKKDGSFYRIPKEQLLGSISAVLLMALNNAMWRTKYSVDDFADAGLSFLPDTITPPSTLKDAYSKNFFSVIPQGIKQIMQITSGQKMFPGVSDIVPKSLQKLEAQYQYTDNTSDFSRAFGRISAESARAYGKIDKNFEVVEVSPIKLDFVIEQFLGRVSKIVTHLPKIATDPVAYLNEFNPFTQRGNFWYGALMPKYYELKEKTTGKFNTKKYKMRDMSKEEIEENNKNLQKIRKLDAIIAAKREVDKIVREQIKELDNDKTIASLARRAKKKELLYNNPKEKNLRIKAYEILKEVQ